MNAARLAVLLVALASGTPTFAQITVKGPISFPLVPLLMQYLDCLNSAEGDAVVACAAVRSDVKSKAPNVITQAGDGENKVQELRRFDLNLAKAEASAAKLAAKKAKIQ